MIADFLASCKRHAPKLVLPAIVVLVALASFGLGRLSALKAGERGLVIYPPAEVAHPTP